MSTPHVVSTPAQVAALCALADRVAGPFPTVGVDVGDGVHAPAAHSQTTHYVTPRAHPTDTTKAAMAVDAMIAAIATNANFARLTAAEQTLIKSAIATAAVLTADWYPPVP